MAHSSSAGTECAVTQARRKTGNRTKKKPLAFTGRGLNPIQEGGTGGDEFRLSRRSIGRHQIYSQTHFQHFSDSPGPVNNQFTRCVAARKRAGKARGVAGGGPTCKSCNAASALSGSNPSGTAAGV